MLFISMVAIDKPTLLGWMVLKCYGPPFSDFRRVKYALYPQHAFSQQSPNFVFFLCMSNRPVWTHNNRLVDAAAGLLWEYHVDLVCLISKCACARTWYSRGTNNLGAYKLTLFVPKEK